MRRRRLPSSPEEDGSEDLGGGVPPNLLPLPRSATLEPPVTTTSLHRLTPWPPSASSGNFNPPPDPVPPAAPCQPSASCAAPRRGVTSPHVAGRPSIAHPRLLHHSHSVNPWARFRRSWKKLREQCTMEQLDACHCRFERRG